MWSKKLETQNITLNVSFSFANELEEYIDVILDLKEKY